MGYQRQEIGRGRTELGREVSIEGVEIFKVNKEELGVMKEAFSVGKDILLGLEASDELLELEEDRVVGGGACGGVVF